MHDDDERDEAWQVVSKWDDLRREPKDAWLFVWKRCGRRPDTTWVGYSEWAAKFGASETSARRWAKRLALVGLVEVVETAPNRVRLYVKEPREVCRARGGEGITGQLRFAQLAEPSSPAGGDVAGGTEAERIRNASVVALPSEEEARTRAPLPSVPSEPLKPEGTDPRSASASVAVPSWPAGEVKPIGASMAAAVERWSAGPTAAEVQRDVDQLVFWILKRVDDPKLRQSPCVRVARAIVEGRLPRSELDLLLAWVDQKSRENAGAQRWSCFAGTAMRIFERHGLAWPTSARRKDAASLKPGG